MNRLRPIFLKIAAALALQAAAADLLAQQTQHLPVIPLNVGVYLIHAEVAATPAQREQGLMFRDKLGANDGMVFLFEAPSQVCMWMKNTLIPLSVAFIDSKGKIINIEEMQAQTTNSHCAKRAASYALEMNSGWFSHKHIVAGMTIDGLPQ